MRWSLAACVSLLVACVAATTSDEGPERGDPGRDAPSGRAPVDASVSTPVDALDTTAAADLEGSGDTADVTADDADPTPDATPDATPDVTADVAAPPDAADSGDLADGRPVNDDCEQLVATAEPVFRPVDIVWVIDTSGSMNQEIALIEREMANFVAFIADSDLDYRVVLIAADPPVGGSDTLGVC